MAIQAYPVEDFSFTYVAGLAVSYASGTTLSVAAGQCRDSNNVMDLVLGTAPLNGATTAAPLTINAAARGLNGLDAGALAASTMYAVYIIGDSYYNNPVGAILTLAANTSPVLPAGYDSVRLVSFVLTSGGSVFLPYYIGNPTGNARTIQYDAPISVLNAGAATSYATVNLAAAVPATRYTRVTLNTVFTATAASTANIRPGGATAAFINQTAAVTAQAQNEQVMIVPRNATFSPQVDYQVSAGTLSLLVSSYDFSL